MCKRRTDGGEKDGGGKDGRASGVAAKKLDVGKKQAASSILGCEAAQFSSF